MDPAIPDLPHPSPASDATTTTASATSEDHTGISNGVLHINMVIRGVNIDFDLAEILCDNVNACFIEFRTQFYGKQSSPDVLVRQKSALFGAIRETWAAEEPPNILLKPIYGIPTLGAMPNLTEQELRAIVKYFVQEYDLRTAPLINHRRLAAHERPAILWCYQFAVCLGVYGPVSTLERVRWLANMLRANPTRWWGETCDLNPYEMANVIEDFAPHLVEATGR